jgi:hypothetical protein
MAKKVHTSRHHRKPRSLGGKHGEENISLVCSRKHEAWHLLFSNHTPEHIAIIINNVWLDPHYEFIVRKKG